jgi:hypothetical protein
MKGAQHRVHPWNPLVPAPELFYNNIPPKLINFIYLFFSEEIIPVKFVVYFKTKISPDDACAPLENAIRDNKLGNLKIVPGSLGCSQTTGKQQFLFSCYLKRPYLR